MGEEGATVDIQSTVAVLRLWDVCRVAVQFEGQRETKNGLMVKCTPERGHNALFFIPLEVIIML